ncbi:MAG TPA: hypothetical protein DHV48_12925 [Prolixibacteraceae bacterium]|nr:hypothetical protein [Prolixibacteraceae bacterium]
MKKFRAMSYAAFAGILLLCTAFPVNSIAGVRRIPIFYGGGGGGGGHISPTMAIGLLIAFNIPMVLIYIIRSIIWAVKHDKFDTKYSFFEYVIWGEGFDLYTPVINTLGFISLNGIALLIWIAILISDVL